MDKKKRNELTILRKVYSETEYEIIREGESPDFTLSDKKNNVFGVEVTKYFDTPTSARFKNISNYTEKLINSKFIHKQDIGILEVGEIVKVDDNGKEISSPDKGILRELPQSVERINVLKNIISRKNIKHTQQYDKSMQIDLLIYDSGDLTAGLEIQRHQILNYLQKQEKANTLVSPFREIILLIEESNKSTMKILLKSI
ncbi:TPA: hypothetical protein DEP90_02555 [Patescibacteria group bacterium]|nr:hypothetical protein [Patescibacteria group bacterium]